MSLKSDQLEILLGVVCSNDDPVVTLTYFTARSNLVFLWEKVKTMDFFQKQLQPVT